VASSCEHGNKTSRSIKCGECVEQLRGYLLSSQGGNPAIRTTLAHGLACIGRKKLLSPKVFL
jgi:hypothetical protein